MFDYTQLAFTGVLFWISKYLSIPTIWLSNNFIPAILFLLTNWILLLIAQMKKYLDVFF